MQIESDGIVYVNLETLSEVLMISKREISYDFQTEYLTLLTRDNKIQIGESTVLFNNVVALRNGYISYQGFKYVPLRVIVECFNGTYLKKGHEIRVEL